MYNDLFDDQKQAFHKIMDLIINKKNNVVVFRAAGGTGKTTVLRALGKFLSDAGLSLSCMALAGRAAGQLAKTGLVAGTCHSYLYKPVLDLKGNLIRWDKRTAQEIQDDVGDIIAVDEGSMVNYTMYNDIMTIGRQ
jgi:ATP-dependent exoDNAse (exonuclease V) alpha subunit